MTNRKVPPLLSSAQQKFPVKKKAFKNNKQNMKNFSKPFAALALLTPLAFAGCGGGSNDGPKTPNIDAAIANQSFLGLLSGGTSIVRFRGNATNNSTARTVSGLPAGVSLRGIDARVAPRMAPNPGTVAGDNGVSAIYALGTNDQLYTLDFTGTGPIAATAVGTPAVFNDFTLRQGAYGFDFNPAADRLRVVSGTQNSRINPNNGAAVDSDANVAGVNPDGVLSYDASDVNAGKTPNITAAGYTNNDNDAATGTVNYGIDTASKLLVTQGRPAVGAAAAVSPNTGTLFTVGSLGNAFPDNASDVGLEVYGSQNTAVATAGNSFYSVNLTSGVATRIGRFNSGDVVDVTVALS